MLLGVCQRAEQPGPTVWLQQSLTQGPHQRKSLAAWHEKMRLGGSVLLCRSSKLAASNHNGLTGSWLLRLLCQHSCALFQGHQAVTWFLWRHPDLLLLPTSVLSNQGFRLTVKQAAGSNLCTEQPTWSKAPKSSGLKRRSGKTRTQHQSVPKSVKAVALLSAGS